MSEKNYFDILVSPVITEKSSMLSESNKVVFKVGMKSSKSEIKKSIEELFKVKVKFFMASTNSALEPTSR